MESDGIDEALAGVTQLALTTAARMGEQLARAREQELRAAQARSAEAAQLLGERHAVERAAARATLAAVHRPEWWASAHPEQIAAAYQAARAWSRVDPEAARAEQRIAEEVRTRHGVTLSERPRLTVDEARALAKEHAPNFYRRHDAERLWRTEFVNEADRSVPNSAAQSALIGDWEHWQQHGRLPEDSLIVEKAIAEGYEGRLQDAARKAVDEWERQFPPSESGLGGGYDVPEHRRGERGTVAEAARVAEARRAGVEGDALRGAAHDDRAEALGLLAGADAADRAAEADLAAGRDPESARSEAAQLLDAADEAYDSAQRRQALAESLGHLGNQAAVDARVQSDVAQGRPATDAVASAPGRAPKARRGRSKGQGAQKIQQRGR